MRTNEKTAIVLCGDYVVIEEFVGERSEIDALTSYFTKEIKKSTTGISWRETEFY